MLPLLLHQDELEYRADPSQLNSTTQKSVVDTRSRLPLRPSSHGKSITDSLPLPECATDTAAARPTNCESSTNSSVCRPSTSVPATQTPAPGNGGQTSRATHTAASLDTRPCSHTTRWLRASPAQRCARSISGRWYSLVDRRQRERNDHGGEWSRAVEETGGLERFFVSLDHQGHLRFELEIPDRTIETGRCHTRTRAKEDGYVRASVFHLCHCQLHYRHS